MGHPLLTPRTQQPESPATTGLPALLHLVLPGVPVAKARSAARVKTTDFGLAGGLAGAHNACYGARVCRPTRWPRDESFFPTVTDRWDRVLRQPCSCVGLVVHQREWMTGEPCKTVASTLLTQATNAPKSSRFSAPCFQWSSRPAGDSYTSVKTKLVLPVGSDEGPRRLRVRDL